MASLIMLFAVFSFFIAAVTPSGDFWTLDCPSSSIVAFAGQTTVITCSFRNIQEINIVSAFLRKDKQEDTTLYKNKTPGNSHFSLKNPGEGPSLQISETMFSDEGKYVYRVVTDRGVKEVPLSISITAKYKEPITSTWPEKVTERGPVDLYCNATNGYPAGYIHWFDRSGFNWTKSSEMIKTNKDSNNVKSVALSSKLSFKSIDSAIAPFRCIVFNSKYVQDGESTLEIQSARSGEKNDSTGSNTTNIVAGVMVIGSLIVGLLFALLLFRKKKYNGRRPSSNPILSYEQGNTAEDDVENGETVLSIEASTIKR